MIDNQTRDQAEDRFRDPGRAGESIQPVGIGDQRTIAPKPSSRLGPANRVAVIDAQSYEVKDYLLVGQRVWQLAFAPDEKFLYSSNGVSNDISVIDVDAEKVVQVGRGRRHALGCCCQGLTAQLVLKRRGSRDPPARP